MDQTKIPQLRIPEESALWKTMQRTRTEAIMEGKVEGKLETAVKMLKSGFNMEKVAELTGLGTTIISLLQAEIQEPWE